MVSSNIDGLCLDEVIYTRNETIWFESKLETIFNFLSALERDARERRVGQKINIKKEHCTILFLCYGVF